MALGEVEELGDIERRQDDVDRRHREPAQPVGPSRGAADAHARVSPTRGRDKSVANDGIPPVRSGQTVASSARQKQRKHPRIVMAPMRRIPAAPMPLTTTGAIPVTRIVPARPITNAPHQFVPC